jgi:geranylgeranyl reductase family protein
MMDSEILVAGAGPAGSIAAGLLARSGRSVLLVDRQEFPRVKPCGEGLPAPAARLLHGIGLGDAFNEHNFYPIRNVRVVSPHGRVIDSDHPSASPDAYGFTARRRELDLMLRDWAVASGARFLVASVKKPFVDNGRVAGVAAVVAGREERIACRVLVGADGVNSPIARAVRTGKSLDGHGAVALRGYVPHMDCLPHTIEFHFRAGGLPCYSWIFPFGDGSANVGVGLPVTRPSLHNGLLKLMMKSFLESPAIRERIRGPLAIQDIAGARIDYGSAQVRRAFEGGVLIGDAGSLADPLTGGGIYNSLRSARMAAGVIESALASGDLSYRSLKRYETEIDRAFGSRFRKLHLVERLISSEWIVEILIQVLRSRSLLQWLFVRLDQK